MTEPVRVLHVDDDSAFAELTATYLEQRDGFEVDVETDPEAALDRLTDSGSSDGSRDAGTACIDCVVSDHEMGTTTGLDLLKSVRAVDERLPFVLFTSRGSEEVASEAISAGVTDYIQKGVRSEQFDLLANRVQNAVEHYRTERRLRESEQLYRTVVERSHDAIYVYQGDRFRFVNHRACELTGYDEDELMEKTIWSLVHPDDRERVRDIAAERARGESDTPSRYTARIVTKDGSAKRCKFSVQLIRYEGERAVLGSVREMSDEERVEERFQALIERSSDLVTIVDRDGVVQYQSPSSERILGTAPEDAMGTTVQSFVHADDRERVERLLDRLYESPSDAVETMQFRVRHDDGSWVWLEAVARADPVESIDGVVVNSRDVTERREREEQLQRYENVVRNIQQGAYVIGTDGRVEFVNHVVEWQVGVSAEQIVGEDLSVIEELGLVSEDGLEALEAGVERVLSGEVEHERIELEVFLAGDIEYVEVGLSPLRDVRSSANEADDGTEEEPEGVVAIATDVTERTRYQRRLSALHSASRELTTATTYDDVAEIVSDAAENILDYPMNGVAFYDEERDALVAHALSEEAASAVDISDIPRGNGIAWRVFESGEGEVFEDVVDDPDVMNPETEVQSEVILPIGDYGVLMAGSRERGKLNDSRVSLAKILASNARAALERVEREQLLRRHERELEHQNEQLEQVASVVSHDLRNPLNLASGQLEMLRASHEAGDDESVAARIERIENAHERMRRIVEDMLNLARHGQPVEELETVLLASVVRESWETATAGDSGAELAVDDDLGTVEAHEGRVKQLFENLFRNSVEHGARRASGRSAPGDSVEHGSTSDRTEFGADTESHAITVRVGRLDGGDGFFVDDDGCGIPEADRGEVFEPGVSTNPEGTGLGLGIVRTIARAHGWTVSVTESESGGARFEVRTEGDERSAR